MANAVTEPPSSQSETHSTTGCFHCGLPVDDDHTFTLQIKQKTRHFCCAGCQAVASMIHEGGLDQFYQYRSELNKKPDEQHIDFSYYDRDDIQNTFVRQGDHHEQKVAYLLLDGITCAACVWLIEKHLQSIPGVSRVSVNATTHQCVLVWDVSQQALSHLMTQLANIGYRPQPFTRSDQQQQQQRQQRQLLFRLGLAGFGMMQVGMVAVALYTGADLDSDPQWAQLLRWVSLIVATPIVLFSAQPFWLSAWRSLKQRHLTMDVPVSLAILLAYGASVWATWTHSGEVYFDSISMFTFFLLLGRYIEMRMRYRNQQVTGNMTELLPMTVMRVEDGQQEADIIALADLAVGDLIRVHSGDTLPCDGVVIDGRSAVTEALLTGESIPIDKQVGDEVIAGTVNTHSSLLVKVTATGDATRLSMINHLVDVASQDKPAIQQLADQVASYFVAAVLIVSSIVFVSWFLVEPESALWVTLSVLVVTCPCALALATPTALTAAVAKMRQNGVLILKGHVIETLTHIDHIVFDKTGTLTYGQPQVNRIVCLDDEMNYDDIFTLAATLEQGSSHPIAKAFQQAEELPLVTHLTSETGQGVSGMINGANYRLGKIEFALENDRHKQWPPDNSQWLLLSRNRQPLAWIEINDQLRESATDAVAELTSLGLPMTILSGDREAVVKTLAEPLGLDYLAEQSPEEKLEYLKKQQENCRVMMVGDGINDVPVLAGADVSVAMDSATDFARTKADSVLLQGNLGVIAKMITLAHRGKAIIRQNLAWALGYNLIALPLAALGFIPPYLAAIGMSASSLVVVFNALRLYR